MATTPVRRTESDPAAPAETAACAAPQAKVRRAADTAVGSLTPAMRQYVEQKRTVGDAILLFRMGDFYETFFEDAALCARVLGIALTSRDKGENPVPMAGIPHHALDSYLARLVKAGYKVAISEQLEDPRFAKGLIKRDVTRIVTAGTLTDDRLLKDRESNVLAALCLRGGEVGAAVVELVGGRFEVLDVTREALPDELARLGPAEILVEDAPGNPAVEIVELLRQIFPVTLTRRAAHEFALHHAERTLLEHFSVATLSGFGFAEMDASLCAAGAIVRYLRETQRCQVAHLSTLTRRVGREFVQIDQSTWRSLEIAQTLRGASREGSLLHAVDRTVHAMGGRTLRRWLAYPLRDEQAITARQDAVAHLAAEHAGRQRLRDVLRSAADVERIASRVALARATPRDVKALGRTLDALPAITAALGELLPAFLEDARRDLSGFEELALLLRRAIRDDAPLSTREGGIIADGYHPELDRLYAISRDGQTWLAEYQRRQAEDTGIEKLKVSYNHVFGYYIEITHPNRDRVPPHYIRRQTVKNAERYVTEELKKFEDEVLTAEQRAHDLEAQLFEEVRKETAAHATALLRLSDALGRLDVAAGLAELAVDRRYVRPRMTDGAHLDIRDGRHPVLDALLAEEFVANDTIMTGPEARVFVITGPNMAGKSTYIRQVALLTLMAQTGSFVPASAMTFSPVDRIFARVGASDEIMRGQSTFMVEMTEAANILRNATRDSLVILDELGRGTSTFDGLSLAWAITEHLASETKCRTLVATHYHELTELEELLKGVKNYNVAVREVAAGQLCELPRVQRLSEPLSAGAAPAPEHPSIIFLHRIVEGGADKSYGVHVARLAGIPASVIRRSIEILEELQLGFERKGTHPHRAARKSREDGQLALFIDPGDELMTALRELDPDRLTPLEALQRLTEWKRRFGR
ncbi:MAG: DNA mismatch repair protein MutS [Phycisphaerales bacterium]|nr:DNA mismatch repair protein MutS [Phycisphaerales bacterium]